MHLPPPAHFCMPDAPPILRYATQYLALIPHSILIIIIIAKQKDITNKLGRRLDAADVTHVPIKLTQLVPGLHVRFWPISLHLMISLSS